MNANHLSIASRNILHSHGYCDIGGRLARHGVKRLKEALRSRAALRWRNVGPKTFRNMCEALDVVPDKRVQVTGLTITEADAVRAIRGKDAKALRRILKGILS